jgi:hypothetical protein
MVQIKAFIKKIILLLPMGDRIVRKIQSMRNGGWEKSSGEMQPTDGVNAEKPPKIKQIFTYYYLHNAWANPESVSGIGSTIAYTETIRRELPVLLEKYQIKRFLDAPCGDYNWMQIMRKPSGMEYIGGDIVEELIVQNQQKYGDQNTSFIPLDITTDPLPPSDMWMCRDCLLHLSYEDIFKTLANFLHSDVKYLLTSVHTACTVNKDIETGDARLIHLELPPFGLCRPIEYIDDWIPGYPERKMGLWTKSMVAESLASNPMLHSAGRTRNL